LVEKTRVVEVNALDRPALLAALARAIRDCGRDREQPGRSLLRTKKGPAFPPSPLFLDRPYQPRSGAGGGGGGGGGGAGHTSVARITLPSGQVWVAGGGAGGGGGGAT